MSEALPGDGMSTKELFTAAAGLLGRLRKALVEDRRNKDRARSMVKDLHLMVHGIARRVNDVEFHEGRVRADDDEDEMPLEAQGPGGMSLVEALTPAVFGEGVGAENEEESTRLEHFRIFVDYLCQGARHESEVTRKLLALVRRVRPEALRKFGLSQADVARKLGERRATVSAREKRAYERPVRATGARGALGAGARGEETRRRCAEAQRGNRNRRGGGHA